MGEVIIEVDDAEPDDAALRAATPELFDVRSLVEAGAAVIVGARDRAAEDLVAVEKIAEEAGWARDQVAELRAEVERAKDGIGGALVPEAVQIDVEDEADETATGRGPAWSSRRVTVTVANKDAIVAAVATWARELERFHAFVRDAEAQVAELHRLEGKLRETEAHLADLEVEVKLLEADAPEDTSKAPRLERVKQQVEQARDKTEHRRGQIAGQRGRLGGMLGTYLSEKAASDVASPLEEALQKALAVERSQQYLVHNLTVEARLAREARFRTVVRRTAIAIGVGAVVAGAVVGTRAVITRPAHVAESPLERAKAEILDHPFLKERLTQEQQRMVREAATEKALRDVFLAIVDDLGSADRDPGWWTPREGGLGNAKLVRVGDRQYRVDAPIPASVMESIRKRFGEEATVEVKLEMGGAHAASWDPDPAKRPMNPGTLDLPATLADEILCTRGTGLRFELTIPLPFGKDFKNRAWVPVADEAWRLGDCENLSRHFYSGMTGRR